MRILYAVHGYKPAYRIGGPILSVSSVAERLVRKGHRVVVFTSNSNLDQDLDISTNQPIDVDGVEVWYFRRYEPLKKIFPFFTYFSKSMGFLYTPDMKQALNNIMPKVDLVHTHLPFIYPTYAAAKSSRKNNKPLFYHQRGVFDPGRLKFRSFKKRIYISLIEKPIMRQATTLIALTEFERDNYRALGVRTHCEVVPNGIDVSFYRSEARPGSMEKFNIRENQSVILFLGRLHPVKGVDMLLKAFSKIAGLFPDSLLVLAGPDEYCIEQEFKKKASNPDLIKRVIFTGMVEGEDKINLLARANLFCLPSIGEGFSVSILEALASATPVLISRQCHFPDVEKCHAGWIIERQVDEWAKKMATLLKDQELLKKTGENACKLAMEKYSWDNIVEKVENVYIEGVERYRRNTSHKL